MYSYYDQVLKEEQPDSERKALRKAWENAKDGTTTGYTIK